MNIDMNPKMFFLFSFAFMLLHGQNKSVMEQRLNDYDRLFFIENRGQWHSDVLYLCRMGGLDAWITKYGVNYNFYKIENDSKIQKNTTKDKFNYEDLENKFLLGHRVIFELQNYNLNPQTEGSQRQEGYYNYFKGNDPSKHASFVGLYKEAVVKNVYDGIDIRYYFDKGYLRHDYIVHPGADPSQIRFKLRGQYNDFVKDGKIAYTTRFGEVQLAELHTYQAGKNSIPSKFVKQNDIYSIALGNYDISKDLIIDPLIYSTFIGGSVHDISNDIAIDPNGNAYITGSTSSPDYDYITGSYQTNKADYDIFITKVKYNGNSLIFSSIIGGDSIDTGNCIFVDDNHVYIGGESKSTNYPAVLDYHIQYHSAGYDGILTKLNSLGSSLTYSTYLGGSNVDGINGIYVLNGYAYVTGRTASTNFLTQNAFQSTLAGGLDVFIAKINIQGNGLVYSTFLGGIGNEIGTDIFIDSNGNAYITGFTTSIDFDLASAYQNSIKGYTDVFISKLNPNGNNLLYSTYFGGADDDYATGIKVVNGSIGNNPPLFYTHVYITGYTKSSTQFPISSNAYQTSYGGGNFDAFVSKFNINNNALIYSTYIGGSDEDYAYDIALQNDLACIIGHTSSIDFDITNGAYQTANEGYFDVFVTKLNSNGSNLLYSTYLGGSGSDKGKGIQVDTSGYAYLTGYTGSHNFDIVLGAYQNTYGGGSTDVFVTKLEMSVTTSIQTESLSPYNYQIYPNPNQGNFTIHANTDSEWNLLDITGKHIQSFVVQGKTVVQTNLPKGLYFIQEKQTGVVQKLIIE